MRNVNISDNSTDFTIWSFSGTNNTGFTVRNNTYVADGAVNINLGYVDFAGNAGNATRLFYIDTVAPSITITSPTATAYGSSSITLAYTASDAVSGISSCSYRLDSASATTAGSSVSTTLNVNDGSRTITVTCTDGVGYSTTQSVTFTVSVGGGPPSTYVGSPSNDQSKIIIPSMKEGASKTINITKGEHGIRQITISVNNNVNSINIEISKLPGQPASVTKEISGKVYKYMEINKTNIKSEDISKIKIRFVVDKKWLEENNVSADSVVLNRYTTEWNKLPTTKVGETANEIEYEAESPGLSLFAVSSEPKAQAPAQPEVPQAPAQTKVSEPQTDMTFYIAILAVIVALVAAAAIYLRKSGKKK